MATRVTNNRLSVPLEPSKPGETTDQPTFTVDREVSMSGVLLHQIESNNLELDSDIYDESNEEAICLNREFYVDNSHFSNEKEINDYLRFWGKIPSFLEVRSTPGRGYGVFATIDISPGVFISQYLGIIRQGGEILNPSSHYRFGLICGSNSDISVDAQNMTFSNVSRFINHSDTPNCVIKNATLMVLIYSSEIIHKDTELTISYGEDYWDNIRDVTKDVTKDI